ncbi:MAG TPA: nucleotide sugar dehydrogenase [Alphaproteobacteria bacterium]|nr:nucleotide sugar dehydrogenase [Alphaproteobacteria bacterium]
MALPDLIRDKKAKVAVVGMGYVGLPLACAAADAGFEVYGFDINPEKVAKLNAGQSYIYAVPDAMLQSLAAAGKFRAGTDAAGLKEADIIEICVPTPLNRYREPDLTPVIESARTIASQLRPGQLIILESTTYPGTTREVVIPILEESGLKYGHDFSIGYSPEREDPGNKSFTIKKIPKVVGADDDATRQILLDYYGSFIDTVVPVSSLDTAEAVKITENIFRSVNIALVNELKMIYDAMGIDVWEVIEGAKTKPFGYMPFYPGPGLGGHCIPIDPFYLTYRARAFDKTTKFIELAGEINTAMPHYVVERIIGGLDRHCQKALTVAKILLVGMAYKNNINDTRQSPALEIMHQLIKRGGNIDYHDPHVPELVHLEDHAYLQGRKSVALTAEILKGYDAAVILANHDNVDCELIRKNVRVVIDTRNVFGKLSDSDKATGALILKA